MSEFVPNNVKLALNGTNLGHFQNGSGKDIPGKGREEEISVMWMSSS